MTEPLALLLAELEQFGQTNDATITERPRRMLNITRDTGEFLVVLVIATAARRILEIGTSNGYSTLWLADAARQIDGSVTTVELSPFKISLASANFARSGLSAYISLVHDDAGRVLERCADGSVDLVFLDSERPEYPGWWPDLKRVLRPGGFRGRQCDVSSGTDGAIRRAGPSRSGVHHEPGAGRQRRVPRREGEAVSP